MLKVEEFYFGWFVFRVVFEVKRRRKCWGFWGLVFVVVGRERNCWGRGWEMGDMLEIWFLGWVIFSYGSGSKGCLG